MQLFRKLTRWAASLYFSSLKKNKLNYLPPSGKVIEKDDLMNLIDASLDMWLTAGSHNEEFEKQLAGYINKRYALTTNSGSSANLLAVTALTSHKLGDRRLKKGDEVLTLAAGFPTTIAPIIQNGLIPVFIDLEIGTYNINIDHIESSITSKTKAIILAHTLGNPFNISKVMEIAKKYNLWLIEDNCDALGSIYDGKMTGSYGDISTCSFYPAHHITMGEGGALLTNNIDLYKIIMSFRDWGRDCWCPPGKDDTCNRRFAQQFGNLPAGYDHKYTYSHIGYNLKITDWQAAIGLSQLKKLSRFVEQRNKNFDLLTKGLKSHESYLILPQATEKSIPSWFGYLITVKENDRFNKLDLVKFLEDNKIGTRQLFAGNILRQPAFTDDEIYFRIHNSKLLSTKEINENIYKMLPNTETVMNSTFWIGIWPGLTKENIQTIIDKFHLFFKKI